MKYVSVQKLRTPLVASPCVFPATLRPLKKSIGCFLEVLVASLYVCREDAEECDLHVHDASHAFESLSRET